MAENQINESDAILETLLPHPTNTGLQLMSKLKTRKRFKFRYC